MAHENKTLVDTFENDNEAFKALTAHVLEKEIDYDSSIS